MPETKRVFLSHSADDKVFAGRLAELMIERGATVFLDGNLAGGDDWTSTLRREIEHASALVLLLPSTTAPRRNNLLFEAGVAKALGKRVLAVRPPDSRIGELPYEVVDVLVLDASDRPLDVIADTLIEAVPDRTDHLH